MADGPQFADWLAITQVKAAYCRLLDTKDWQGWGDLFTDDVVVDVTGSGGSVMEGRAAMVATVSGSLAGAKTAHQVHFPEIHIDGDRATAIWPMQDRVEWPGGRALTGYGHYHEDYVREGGRWRIARQRLTRLAMNFDTQPA